MKEKTEAELKQIARQLASTVFLTKRYPKTWKGMSKKELTKFIKENIYEPYKDQPVDLIKENIRILSGEFMRFGAYYSNKDDNAVKISVTQKK